MVQTPHFRASYRFTGSVRGASTFFRRAIITERRPARHSRFPWSAGSNTTLWTHNSPDAPYSPSIGASLAAAQQSAKPNVLFFFPDQVRAPKSATMAGIFRRPISTASPADLSAMHALPGDAADGALADAFERRHELDEPALHRGNPSAMYLRRATPHTRPLQ